MLGSLIRQMHQRASTCMMGRVAVSYHMMSLVTTISWHHSSAAQGRMSISPRAICGWRFNSEGDRQAPLRPQAKMHECVAFLFYIKGATKSCTTSEMADIADEIGTSGKERMSCCSRNRRAKQQIKEQHLESCNPCIIFNATCAVVIEKVRLSMSGSCDSSWERWDLYKLDRLHMN